MRVVWVVALVTGLAQAAAAEAPCPPDRPVPWEKACLGHMEAYRRCTEDFSAKNVEASEKKTVDAKLQASFRTIGGGASGDARALVQAEKAIKAEFHGTRFESLGVRMAEHCYRLAQRSPETSKKPVKPIKVPAEPPASCQAKIEEPTSQGATGPIEVADKFDVVAAVLNPIPANRAFFVLHEKQEDEMRHWYKGKLTLKGGKAIGKVNHLGGRAREIFTLKVVAVDVTGQGMIQKVKTKGREQKLWDEIIGIDAHFVECASFEVTKKE